MHKLSFNIENGIKLQSTLVDTHVAPLALKPGLHSEQISVVLSNLQLAQFVSLQATHFPSVAVAPAT